MKEKIYNFLKVIPKGKVITYKMLSDKFGIHSRAVAKILSQNQEIDIYPCYKVILNDGKIGGYNRGTEEKIRRLENDGIVIKNNKISKEYFWI